MAESIISSVPTHLGLILDGNRRWAKARGLPALEGHRHGAEVFKQTVKAAFHEGVEYISAYVFSTENWTRTQEEVSYLMNLLIKFVEKDLGTLHQEGIRVIVLGTREGLDERVSAALDRVIHKTKDNDRGTLAMCFNYGGQLEVVDAVKQLMHEGFSPEDVTIEEITRHLYCPELPPVDLIIRTSGEQRLSNFMLWRSTYSELLFVDKFWPDFTGDDLKAALTEYDRRQRRFGS